MIAVFSCLLAICTSVVTGILLALMFDGLDPGIAWTALALGALAGGSAMMAYRDRVHWKWCRNIRGWDLAALIAFALFALRAFCWVIYQTDERIKVLLVNNRGDMCKHWNFVAYFANGCSFWPDEPIFEGIPIRYPFGIDFFNSLLSLTGLGLIPGFVWAGLIGSALTAATLFLWGRGFALAGFLFSGGLAGFAVFWQWELIDYQADLAWKNIPLALFITQRSFLYAVPAGLLLLSSWRRRLQTAHTGDAAPKAPALPIWGETVLYATMPLMHFHTFLFLSLLLAWRFIAGPSEVRRHALLVVGLSFPVATLLVALLTDFFSAASAVHFQAGWMQHDTSFLKFWLGNFGLYLPLCLALGIALLVGSGRVEGEKHVQRAVARGFVFPCLFVFGLCSFFVFAPWEWDNTKLLLWFYLGMLPFIWEFCIRPATLGVRAALCVVLFFSGGVSLLGGLSPPENGYTIARRPELDGVNHALRDMPKEAWFACAPEWEHPLVLAGRKVVMGYDGHLFSYGIDYSERHRRLTSLMNGEADWRQLAKQLNADYVFWGEREERKFPKSDRPWEAECPPIDYGDWGAIYDLRPLR